MFKNKKMLSLLIIVLMMTALLSACGGQSKTAKETLNDAFMNDLDVNTQEFKVDMSIQLNGTNVNDPQFDLISGVANNAKVVLTGKTDTVARKAEINANVNVGGMAFEGKLFIDDKKIALNVPVLGMMLNDPRLSIGYIIIDTEVLMAEYGQEQVDMFGTEEEMEQLATRTMDMFLDLFDENMFVNNGKKDIVVGESNIKATEIQMNIGENEFKSIVMNALQKLKDPEFANLLFDITALSNPDITREEFDNELDTMLTELDTNFDGDIDRVFEEMKEVIDFDKTNLNMSVYINDKSNVVKGISDISLGVKENDTSVEVLLNTETDAWNINQPLTIEIPEMDESNSVDFYELMFMVMSGNLNY